MGDIELTCDAGMTNEHENDNSETARKEGLESREMYDALRRVVFQKQKCSLKSVGNISREQFQSIVFCINSEIELINSVVPEDGRIEYLDQQLLLQIFDKIEYRMEREAFRKKYGCLDCLYYEKPRRCFETKYCPLEDGEEPKKTEQLPKPRCPNDIKGDCPYGNEIGTCFGFCWQEILSEHRERKRRNEQIKEEKADG